ncbi:MAG: 30S ribosomal protein THX [Desulfobacterales bacterium]|nr:30S ribosomal protein THX [Desulfobacterales bacterium]
MGKGDRRTRRGKIWRGSTGKARPKKKKMKAEK